MSFRAILQTSLSVALWVGAGVALLYGMWIPMVALIGAFLAMMAIFALPGALARRRRQHEETQD